MIRRLRVANFQALKDVDLELGGLTIIVGPSSVGKTALIRALSAMISNPKDAAHLVTHGQTRAVVEVETEDSSVIWERGKGHGAYVLAGKRFEKIGVSVPEEVADALGVRPGDPCVASQFDPPYWLFESGPEVARQIGELTDVRVVLAASAEANRRARSFAAQARVRREDLDHVAKEVARRAVVRDHARMVAHAREWVQRAERAEARVRRLEAAMAQFHRAQGVVAASAPLPEPPDTAPVEKAWERVRRLAALLWDIDVAVKSVAMAEREVTRWEDQEKTARDALEAGLQDAGVCPLCGQEVGQ